MSDDGLCSDVKLVSRHNLWGGVAAFGDPCTAMFVVVVPLLANK